MTQGSYSPLGKVNDLGDKGIGSQLSTKSNSTGNRIHGSTPFLPPPRPQGPVVEGRMLVPTHSLHPPAGWTHAALRTGVPVGAGQTVSSHLRRGLVTSVQELLRAEHVAGVSDPVHAVQDADLGRGRAQWARSLLPAPPPPHPPRSQLFPPCPPASRSSPPTAGARRPPGCNFHPHAPAGSVHPTPVPCQRGWLWKEGDSGYLHDEFIAGVTPIHF